MYQNNVLSILINNSRTAVPARILIPSSSFSDNLHQDNHIIFLKNVYNFKIGHKTCSTSFFGALPL